MKWMASIWGEHTFWHFQSWPRLVSSWAPSLKPRWGPGPAEATGQDHSGHSPMSTTNNIHSLRFDEGSIVTYWACPYWRASSRYMAGNKQLPCDIPGLGVPMKNQPGPITGSLIHPELIFVTDITDYICGEKSVMWQNFRFLQFMEFFFSKFMPFLF